MDRQRLIELARRYGIINAKSMDDAALRAALVRRDKLVGNARKLGVPAPQNLTERELERAIREYAKGLTIAERAGQKLLYSPHGFTPQGTPRRVSNAIPWEPVVYPPHPPRRGELPVTEPTTPMPIRRDPIAFEPEPWDIRAIPNRVDPEELMRLKHQLDPESVFPHVETGDLTDDQLYDEFTETVSQLRTNMLDSTERLRDRDDEQLSRLMEVRRSFFDITTELEEETAAQEGRPSRAGVFARIATERNKYWQDRLDTIDNELVGLAEEAVEHSRTIVTSTDPKEVQVARNSLKGIRSRQREVNAHRRNVKGQLEELEFTQSVISGNPREFSPQQLRLEQENEVWQERLPQSVREAQDEVRELERHARGLKRSDQETDALRTLRSLGFSPELDVQAGAPFRIASGPYAGQEVSVEEFVNPNQWTRQEFTGIWQRLEPGEERGGPALGVRLRPRDLISPELMPHTRIEIEEGEALPTEILRALEHNSGSAQLKQNWRTFNASDKQRVMSETYLQRAIGEVDTQLTTRIRRLVQQHAGDVDESVLQGLTPMMREKYTALLRKGERATPARVAEEILGGTLYSEGFHTEKSRGTKLVHPRGNLRRRAVVEERVANSKTYSEALFGTLTKAEEDPFAAEVKRILTEAVPAFSEVRPRERMMVTARSALLDAGLGIPRGPRARRARIQEQAVRIAEEGAVYRDWRQMGTEVATETELNALTGPQQVRRERAVNDAADILEGFVMGRQRPIQAASQAQYYADLIADLQEADDRHSQETLGLVMKSQELAESLVHNLQYDPTEHRARLRALLRERYAPVEGALLPHAKRLEGSRTMNRMMQELGEIQGWNPNELNAVYRHLIDKDPITNPLFGSSAQEVAQRFQDIRGTNDIIKMSIPGLQEQSARILGVPRFKGMDALRMRVEQVHYSAQPGVIAEALGETQAFHHSATQAALSANQFAVTYELLGNHNDPLQDLTHTLMALKMDEYRAAWAQNIETRHLSALTSEGGYSQATLRAAEEAAQSEIRAAGSEPIRHTITYEFNPLQRASAYYRESDYKNGTRVPGAILPISEREEAARLHRLRNAAISDLLGDPDQRTVFGRKIPTSRLEQYKKDWELHDDPAIQQAAERANRIIQNVDLGDIGFANMIPNQPSTSTVERLHRLFIESQEALRTPRVINTVTSDRHRRMLEVARQVGLWSGGHGPGIPEGADAWEKLVTDSSHALYDQVGQEFMTDVFSPIRNQVDAHLSKYGTSWDMVQQVSEAFGTLPGRKGINLSLNNNRLPKSEIEAARAIFEGPNAEEVGGQLVPRAAANVRNLLYAPFARGQLVGLPSGGGTRNRQTKMFNLFEEAIYRQSLTHEDLQAHAESRGIPLLSGAVHKTREELLQDMPDLDSERFTRHIADVAGSTMQRMMTPEVLAVTPEPVKRAIWDSALSGMVPRSSAGDPVKTAYEIGQAAREAQKAADTTGYYKRINLKQVQSMWEENKSFRYGTMAAGGFAAFGALRALMMRHRHDHTQEDMAGPPLLPGGSAYEQMPEQTGTTMQPGNPSSAQGVTFDVRAHGDFDPHEFRSQVEDMTGGHASGTIYNTRRRPDPNRDMNRIVSSY